MCLWGWRRESQRLPPLLGLVWLEVTQWFRAWLSTTGLWMLGSFNEQQSNSFICIDTVSDVLRCERGLEIYDIVKHAVFFPPSRSFYEKRRELTATTHRIQTSPEMYQGNDNNKKLFKRPFLSFCKADIMHDPTSLQAFDDICVFSSITVSNFSRCNVKLHEQ